MSELALVYSPRYAHEWPGHVFPVEKYRLTYEAICAAREGTETPYLEPGPTEREALLLVHSEAYLEELEELAQNPEQALLQYEIPLSRTVIEGVAVHCEGTWLATCQALEHGAALNLGGGFHHAFADRGEGFCFYNDIAIALRRAHREGRLASAVVIDCDVHQGNGTAHILRHDAGFWTYSIHQEDLYPVPKQKSTQDVGLWGGAGDAEYLTALRETLPTFLDEHPSELLFYVAGADPFEGDQLGQLRLTREGFRQRDELILGEAGARDLPVVAVLAGGYAKQVRDVVAIHLDLYHALQRFQERRRG